MLRGINRHQVFLEPDDYELFIEVLKECKAISGFKLYACCLMGQKYGHEGVEIVKQW